MAKIHAFIKIDYLDKSGEAPLLVEYSHLKKRWRINTKIKVDPGIFSCHYDEDTQLYKLAPSKALKREQKGELIAYNSTLQELQVKLFRIIGELKLKSLSLSPINVKCEFEKTHPKQQNDQKPIVGWYTDFIKAKEQEIGKGIRSYKGTFNKFRTFLDKKGIILFEHLNKILLEEFKQHLIKLGLEGPHLHKQFKNLRIFINWVKGSADEQPEEIKIPSAYKQVKVKARYGGPIGLTVQQFLQFYRFDLSQHKELERTRNLFVFGVSIGGPATVTSKN